MGGMGSMGRSSGTMPATMGMMMLARIIMYFCGDPDSWDMRSLMIGMMGMAAWAAWAVAWGHGWHGRHGRRYGWHGRHDVSPCRHALLLLF